MTVRIVCTTARIAWSIVTVSCPSIGLRYVYLLVSFNNLAYEVVLAMDRIFLRKDLVAGAGSGDPARPPWLIMSLPQSRSERFHHFRSIQYPYRQCSVLRLPQYIRRLSKSYSTSPILLLPIDNYKATKRLHFRRPQHIPSSHVTGKTFGIRLLLHSST